MLKNVGSQVVAVQMVSATDGSAFTGTVTVYVTGNAGTQALGSVGSGVCTHEGNGTHSYAPAQAETNYDNICFTFIGTGAVPALVQIYPLPTTGILSPATAGRTLVVDAAGLADANMVKAGPSGSGTAQTAKDIGGAVPAAAAGASGGLLISGSNSGTTTLGALTVTGATTLTGAVTGTNASNDLRGILLQATQSGVTIPTVTTVTNQLTAAAIATGVWQDSTSGDFTSANSIGKCLYINNIAPGASGGHFISGSNAGTTTFGALTVTGATTLTGAVSLGSTLGVTGAITATNASNNLTLGTFTVTTNAIAWNSSWDAEVQSECDDALVAQNLDHLVKVAVDTNFSTTVHLDSVIGHLADNGTTATFDRTTDSLEVLGAATAPSAASIADAVWEEAIADHSGTSGSTAEALNAAGSAGDPWTTQLPGAYGAGSAGKIIGDNINATISSRSSHSASDVWAVATRVLTAGTNIALAKGTGVTGFTDLSAADVRTAVGLASANLDTQLGNIVTDTAEIGTAGAGLSAIPWNASWDTEVQSECTDALNAYDPPTKAELDTAESNIRGADSDTLKTLSDQIDAVETGVALNAAQVPIKKNTALANFEFFMADSADHVTGKTGLTITATRSLDGGAFGAMANSATEVGNGIYKINLAQADTNADTFTWKFAATGADTTLISGVTQ